MKKKSSQSAEDFFSTTFKASKELRQNPRFPHKMKVSKNSTSFKPITLQNCQDSLSYPPTTIPALRFRSAYNDANDDILSLKRLRTTFINKNPLQAPYMNFPECMVGTPDKGELSMYSENCGTLSFPRQKMSSTAVQVNIDHCADCRQHRKYGKPLRFEKTGSDCDSESSQTESVQPILVNRRRLKSLNSRRSSKTCPKEADHQQEEPCHGDDQDGATEHIHECGHKIDENDFSNGATEVVQQAQADNEDTKHSEPKHLEILFSVLKLLAGNESPIASIKLVLSLLLLISSILIFIHCDIYSVLSTIGLFYKEDVSAHETYLHKCLQYFHYLFSTTSFPVPVSLLTSLF